MSAHDKIILDVDAKAATAMSAHDKIILDVDAKAATAEDHPKNTDSPKLPPPLKSPISEVSADNASATSSSPSSPPKTTATKAGAKEVEPKPKTWIDPQNPANFIPPGFMSREEYDKKRKTIAVKQRRKFLTIEPTKGYMRAVVLKKSFSKYDFVNFALEEAIELKLFPIPEPEAGEVRVKMKAAAVNNRDIKMCLGDCEGTEVGTILGSDLAGIVDAVGEDVDESMIGREVILCPFVDSHDRPKKQIPCRTFGHSYRGRGCLADYVCCPVEQLFDKPEHLTFEQAAALPFAGTVAYRALVTKAKCLPGDRVLIPGYGGGCASLAMKMATALETNVVVTTQRSEIKKKYAKKYGALDCVYTGKNPKWPFEAKKLLPKGEQDGFDVIIDGLGGSTFGGLQLACAEHARIAFYGDLCGRWCPINPAAFFIKHVQLHGTSVEGKKNFVQMLKFVNRKKVVPILHPMNFDLSQIIDVYKIMDAHGGFGKLIMKSGTFSKDESYKNTKPFPKPYKENIIPNQSTRDMIARIEAEEAEQKRLAEEKRLANKENRVTGET